MSSHQELIRLEAALRRGVERIPGVAAALLFGSWAAGRARAESDIDVALLFETTPPAARRLTTLREAVSTLGQEVDAARLDIVVLDDAPTALAFQVLKHGRVLSCGARARAPRARTEHRGHPRRRSGSRARRRACLPRIRTRSRRERLDRRRPSRVTSRPPSPLRPA